MNSNRWLGSLALGILMLTEGALPSLAGLSQGDFVPCTAVISQKSVTAQTQPYQIRKGDTLWDISSKYHVKLQTLMQMNGLNARSILTVGDTLKIPADPQNVYTVSRGDTLWGIAARNRVNVAALEQANQQLDPQQLQVGDRLVVPQKSNLLDTSLKPSRGFSSLGQFAWPLMGTITSGYGWRKSGFHHGLDIAAEMGTPIRAAAAGVVVFAGTNQIYGNMVILKHADGKQTVYAHAKKLLVKNKQKIKSGQMIATVGVSGNSTGPHVHFEVRCGDETENPLGFLRH